MPCLLKPTTDFPLLLWGNRSHICRLRNLGQVNKILWSFSGIFVKLHRPGFGKSQAISGLAGYWVQFVCCLLNLDSGDSLDASLMVWILCRFGPSAGNCFSLLSVNENWLWSLKFWDCSRDYMSKLYVCSRPVRCNVLTHTNVLPVQTKSPPGFN